jgi:TfoX/Sxy family transcriptional regulator of competence genes
VATLPWADHISEKKMFGGPYVLYKGKMSVGETKGRLMVRVVSEKIEAALAQDHVYPMDFTGKPMKECIFVHSPGFDTEEKLQQWVELGIAHAERKATEKK